MRAFRRTTGTTSQRRLVTFELSPEAFEALQREAALRGLASHHQRAREIVIDALSNREVLEIREMLGELDSSISGLSELIRRNAYSVMVHAARMDAEAANAWIREHMSPLSTRR